MKKILSLILALLMLASVLTACSGSANDEDKGAEISLYFSQTPYDLDPQSISYDSDLLQYTSLLFEGLTKINDKGEVKGALAKKWESAIDSRDDQLKLHFTLNETQWSDGIPVDADDIVFAWKRLLLPETDSYAASLLFPIKNAKAVKSGLMTIDDVGISALSDLEFEVVFEEGFTDVDYFVRTCASPALVPLRSDIVTSNDWARPVFVKQQDDADAMSTIVTNGPFFVKTFTKDYIILERSIYFRNLREGEKLDKHVKPYQLVINFKNDITEQEKQYTDGQLFLLSDFTTEDFGTMKGIKTDEELATFSFYFNTNNKVLKNADVRKALSMALDRNEIAALIGKKVVPATGLVPNGVFESGKSGSFRKNGGELVSASADIEGAKALLKSAGVKSGSFSIVCRSDDEDDVAVCEYAQKVWKSLGFNVTVTKLATKPYAASSAKKSYKQVIDAGDFDVAAVDYVGLTDDAYSFVVPFAKEFSGNVVSVSDDADTFTPHVTGYASDEYNELISGLLVAKNGKERAEIFHNAEKMLLEDMPIAPVYFDVNAYALSGKLSGVTKDVFGQFVLTNAKLANYKKYKHSTEEE